MIIPNDYNIIKDLQLEFENKFSYKILAAIELEFYLLGQLDNKLLHLQKFFQHDKLEFETEDGEDHFEFSTKIFSSLAELAFFIDNVKIKLATFAKQNNQMLVLDAFINDDTPPSSIHFNISLHQNNIALFNKFNNQPSNIMLYAINGLLNNIHNNLDILAPTPNCILRLKSNYIHTPTKICWGYNNRTAAIRIITDNNKICRLEYRVPSSRANIFDLCQLIVNSLDNGLTNLVFPLTPIYGNSKDTQYNYPFIIL